MDTDPFFHGSVIPILYLFSYEILFPFPILHSLPDPFPILILIPILFIYFINTILFHNSIQYTCRYNIYVL